MNNLNNIIAIVDDEPNIRETASFILEMEGFKVVKACNGEEALNIIKNKKPKIVLLDVMMPQKDGYEVCRLIKQDPELRNIFIIMLTAKGQKTDEQRATQVGADCYMTKPFDDEEVLRIIDEIFSQSQEEKVSDP